MKFIHLSDLHLGKRVNEFSMIEEQSYILNEILRIIDDEKPDAVIIAGDVYDKSVPSAEAIELFDDFLYQLSKRKLKVFVISGNHDSAERIAFGARVMKNSGLFISRPYDGTEQKITLNDEFGALNIYLLPFIKPAHVNRYFPQAEMRSYTEAVKTAIENMEIDTTERNIIVTHQFVTGASRSDSEEISVGGTDNVDAEVFEKFDYVALGHIHGAQNMKEGKIRYCGTPLKYSFSEVRQEKSVTVVEFFEKGIIALKAVPLKPQRELREIRGTYMEVTAKSFYEGTPTDDYLHVTLTDELDIPDAVSKLRVIYPNMMKLDYDNARTRASGNLTAMEKVEETSPLELFAKFYDKQNNQPLNDGQLRLVKDLIEKIWEGEE